MVNQEKKENLGEPGPQGIPGNSGVYVGSDEPSGDENIWIDPTGDESTIPEKLPNPYPIIINGNEYDGSARVEFEIEGGSSEGTENYEDLENKPKINNIELTGNKTLEELGIINFSGNYEDLKNKPTIPDVDEITRKINEVYEDYLSASEVIG